MFETTCFLGILNATSKKTTLSKNQTKKRLYILKKARRKARYYREKGFVVGTQDEATFGLIPLIMRGWARRGSHPIVKINHKNECTMSLVHEVQRVLFIFFRKKKRQKQFIEFLEKLRHRWGRYLLFVDGAKAHSGAKVRVYLKKHRKTIKLEYFPKCSPEENPTEQCWKPEEMHWQIELFPH